MNLHHALLNTLKLKEIPRAGWLNFGLNDVESVAAHSWGVSYLSLILAPDSLNKEKVLSMSIIHDLGEALVGDITPLDGISKNEKHELEFDAIKKLTNLVSENEKIIQLWLEYEENSSPEAKFVKACDKLDMALQATYYSSKNNDFNPEEFIQSALEKIDDECMRLLASSTANGKNWL